MTIPQALKLYLKMISVTIHQKNLRCLATEMFKIKNKLAPPFICDLIQESTSRYNTRSHTIVTECENGKTVEDKNIMSVPKVNKVKTGIETFSFTGPKGMVFPVRRPPNH